MEYYAKSPTFVLKENNKKQILEKLDNVINVFYDELEGKDINSLQNNKKELFIQMENICSN